MNIYTGYVYLWYDTKAKFFYLGGHRGKVEDSYICSNTMMLRAYKKRPETFKLRILEYVYGDNTDLRKAEQHWLNMIKDEELYWTPNIYNNTVKYYNQKKHAAGGNGSANKGKSHPAWNKGKTGVQVYSEDRNKKIALSKTKHYPAILVCKSCTKEFETKNLKQIFCSKNCVSKYKWIKWRATKEKEMVGLFYTVPT